MASKEKELLHDYISELEIQIKTAARDYQFKLFLLVMPEIFVACPLAAHSLNFLKMAPVTLSCNPMFSTVHKAGTAVHVYNINLEQNTEQTQIPLKGVFVPRLSNACSPNFLILSSAFLVAKRHPFTIYPPYSRVGSNH